MRTVITPKLASRALQRGDGDAGSLVSEAVTTRVEGSSLHVEICDDGVGGAQPEGSGLREIRDRLPLDGRLRIDSPAGGGTLVGSVIPLAADQRLPVASGP